MKSLFIYKRYCFFYNYQLYHSERFTSTQFAGATKKPLTLTEGRLDSTHGRPNFPPTGTHPSPRSASAWRSVNRLGLLSSTSRRTPCTLWSLMGNTATPHWVVTPGSHWLVPRAPYRLAVTRKDLMPRATGSITVKTWLKQELVSLETK